MMIKKYLTKLSNKQIEHLAGAFRILGIAAFLGSLSKEPKLWDMSTMVLGWAFLEICAIVILSYLEEG